MTLLAWIQFAWAGRLLSGGPFRTAERPGPVVFAGDLDGDGGDDLVWACGDAVCTPDGPLGAGLLAGWSVTDPRFPPIVAGGTVDDRGVVWVAGALRGRTGPPVARLTLPPAVGGFDADGDGAADVLAVAPGGRVVLTFGPFVGLVRNDPDRPGFEAARSAVYATSGESVAHRVWWLPDALGPGRGAVGAQCADDERVGTCAAGYRTLWWDVAARG
ncbi:MAG: hypothetical protein ABMB14_35270, partial [Myxococcota bacterium]